MCVGTPKPEEPKEAPERPDAPEPVAEAAVGGAQIRRNQRRNRGRQSLTISAPTVQIPT